MPITTIPTVYHYIIKRDHLKLLLRHNTTVKHQFYIKFDVTSKKKMKNTGFYPFFICFNVPITNIPTIYHYIIKRDYLKILLRHDTTVKHQF